MQISASRWSSPWIEISFPCFQFMSIRQIKKKKGMKSFGAKFVFAVLINSFFGISRQRFCKFLLDSSMLFMSSSHTKYMQAMPIPPFLNPNDAFKFRSSQILSLVYNRVLSMWIAATGCFWMFWISSCIILTLANLLLQIVLHGINLMTLHQQVRKEALPAELGGTQAPYNNQSWAQQLLGDETFSFGHQQIYWPTKSPPAPK